MAWLAREDIYFMKWPARSIDLNPIANIRALMARYVHKVRRKFHTGADLENASFSPWEKVHRYLAITFPVSMVKRHTMVI